MSTNPLEFTKDAYGKEASARRLAHLEAHFGTDSRGFTGLPPEAVPPFTPRRALETRSLYAHAFTLNEPLLRQRAEAYEATVGQKVNNLDLALWEPKRTALTLRRTMEDADLIIWTRDMWQIATERMEAIAGCVLPPTSFPRRDQLWLSDDILFLINGQDGQNKILQLPDKTEVTSLLVVTGTLGETVNKQRALSGFGAYSDAEVLATYEALLGRPLEHGLDTRLVGFVIFFNRNGLAPGQHRPEDAIPWARWHGPYLAGMPVKAGAECYLLAALEFMSQSVCTLQRERVCPKIEKRLRRDGRHVPEIKRVVLRRRETVPGAAPGKGEGGREWSCQWVVRGFWRRQWYPAARVHRPIYIHPFMKGPADKPLKAYETTVAVVKR